MRMQARRTFTIPPEQQARREVTLMGAGCEVAFGASGFGPSVGMHVLPLPAGPVSGEATVTVVLDEFYAVRMESPRHSEEVRSLMERANRLGDATVEFLHGLRAGSGPVDMAALDRLLNEAERLDRAIRRVPGCEFVERERYSSYVSGMVSEILHYALAHPERFSDGDMYRLILAAIRTGVFNSQPMYMLGDEQLLPKTNAELERRVSESTGDCADLILLGLAGFAIGNNTVYERAQAAAATACGG